MSVKNSIAAIQLTTFNAAALMVGVYQAINPNGLDNQCIILRINNASNVGITISYDGVTDHELLPAAQVLQLDAQTNALPKTNNCCFKRGTIVYIKGAAGVGTIALSGYFQPIGV